MTCAERLHKKRFNRAWRDFNKHLRRARGRHDRAAFKAQHGHWPGEHAGDIGHIADCRFFCWSGQLELKEAGYLGE